jgi:hypothetical protein
LESSTPTTRQGTKRGEKQAEILNQFLQDRVEDDADVDGQDRSEEIERIDRGAAVLAAARGALPLAGCWGAPVVNRGRDGCSRRFRPGGLEVVPADQEAGKRSAAGAGEHQADGGRGDADLLGHRVGRR